MSRLAELISRLEAAESGSRELDALIAAEIEPHLFDSPGFPAERPISPFTYDKGENVIRFDGGGLMDVRFFPTVTASVDAAIALVARVLPGWGGFMDFGHETEMFVADICSHARAEQTGEDEEEHGVDPSQESHGEGRTPALALCVAVLNALQEPRQ